MARCHAIALAQTCPIPGDVPANIDEHVRLARVAAGQGAQVVLFPELSLTGYEINLAPSLAFAANDPRLQPLLDAAKANSLTLLAGAPVRVGTHLHLGLFILAPDGTIGLYTKHHLGAFPPSANCDGIAPPAEATVFHPGNHNPLLRVGDDIAALAICADVGRASHPQQAAERGATMYLASMFVIPSELDGEVVKLQRYAKQHAMLVAFANYGSPSGGLRSAGRSAIWSETGELLVQLDANGAGVAIVTTTPQGRQVQALMNG